MRGQSLLREMEPGEWMATTQFHGTALERWSVANILYELRDRGMVERCRPDANGAAYWRITRLGRDVLDGRVEVRKAGAGRKGRSVLIAAATWLASLPKPNEVRI